MDAGFWMAALWRAFRFRTTFSIRHPASSIIHLNPFNTILVGLKEVWAHKFRSLLTMLGIILGVASLVGMSAIIKGMENGMKETMIALGGADKVLLEQEEVPPEQ